jgi:hypothetical protein
VASHSALLVKLQSLPPWLYWRQ